MASGDVSSAADSLPWETFGEPGVYSPPDPAWQFVGCGFEDAFADDVQPQNYPSANL
jgi:hypothetical protein